MFYVSNKHDSKIACHARGIGKVTLTSVIVAGSTKYCRRWSKRVKEANLVFTFVIIYLYVVGKAGILLLTSKCYCWESLDLEDYWLMVYGIVNAAATEETLYTFSVHTTNLKDFFSNVILLEVIPLQRIFIWAI